MSESTVYPNGEFKPVPQCAEKAFRTLWKGRIRNLEKEKVLFDLLNKNIVPESSGDSGTPIHVD